VSDEQQQRIQELEEQVKELEEILWKSVEANTASSNLVAKMMKRWKPGTQEIDSEHFELLVRCRSALVTCESVIARDPMMTMLGFDTLLDDLRRSIDKWEKRVER
jgi:hypothetical protein